MKKKLIVTGLILIMLLVPVSCAAPLAPAPAPALPPKEVTSFPIEIKDQLGRVVKLERIPQRIISLAPSNTEILFALGLGNKVVVVTNYCNYPPEAQAKPKIGGFTTPNIEEVIVLSPDLVLAASLQQKTIIPVLEGKGLTIFTLDPKTLDEVVAAIKQLGEKEIKSIDSVTGPYDVIVVIEGATLQEIGELITGKIDSIPGISRVVRCLAI